MSIKTRIDRERAAFSALIDSKLPPTLTDEQAAEEISQHDPFQGTDQVDTSDFLDRLAFDPERGVLVVDVDWEDEAPPTPPTLRSGRSRLQSAVARASEQACCRGGAL